MNRLVFRAAVVGLPIVTLAFFGCGGGGGAKVTGTVTMDSQPLSDAEVAFEPWDPAKKGQGGDATRTDAQGKFVFTTSSKKFGLHPGKYKVYISKWVDKKTGQVPPPEEYEMQKAGHMLTNQVASKYSNREIDPVLTAEVKGSGDDFKFEVTGGAGTAAPKKK